MEFHIIQKEGTLESIINLVRKQAQRKNHSKDTEMAIKISRFGSLTPDSKSCQSCLSQG